MSMSFRRTRTSSACNTFMRTGGYISIIVMEDNDRELRDFVKALEAEGRRAKKAANKEEAVSLAKKHPGYVFCLDIDMGRGQEQEGLTALERIKALNSETKVFIRSAYPERFERMATKLHADYFHRKSGDVVFDACTIVRHLTCLERDQAEEALRRMDEKLREFQDDHQRELEPMDTTDRDPNVVAYERCMADARWLSERAGKYVAFINGRLIDEDADRGKLFARLDQGPPDQRVFIKKIEADDRIIGMPTPLLAVNSRLD